MDVVQAPAAHVRLDAIVAAMENYKQQFAQVDAERVRLLRSVELATETLQQLRGAVAALEALTAVIPEPVVVPPLPVPPVPEQVPEQNDEVK